jgi:ankyrin repeat protein
MKQKLFEFSVFTINSIAAESGYLEIVELLIKNTAEINARDSLGDYPCYLVIALKNL